MGLRRFLRKLVTWRHSKSIEESVGAIPPPLTSKPENTDDPQHAAEVDPLPFADEPPPTTTEDDRQATDIALQSRIRNMTVVALHRLPAEIFLKILLDTIPWHHWTLARIHTLAQVCVYWRGTVSTTPAFWPELDINSNPVIQRWVTTKNPHGLLTVRCTKKIEDRERRRKYFTSIAPLAHRWRSMFFQGHFHTEAIKFLETPAPLLSELFLYQYVSDDAVQELVALPEGASLRHIDLDFVTVPWDSSRLTGLETIQIRRLTKDLPSLAQLAEILTSSPRLTWLALVDWKEDEEKPEHTRPPTIKSINLPLLSTLVLQLLPKTISHFLLSTIDSSSCTCVMVDDAQADYFSGYGSHLADIITPSLQSSPKCNVTYDIRKETFRVVSDPSPETANEWMPWMKVTAGIDLTIHSDARQLIQTVQAVMGKRSSSADDALNLCGMDTEPDVPGKADSIQAFPVDILQSMGSVKTFRITGYIPIGEVLSCLSRPREGASSWPCPKLERLDVVQWQGDMDALPGSLIAFGRSRYGEDALSSGVSAPEELGKVLVPDAVVEKVKESGAFRCEVL